MSYLGDQLKVIGQIVCRSFFCKEILVVGSFDKETAIGTKDDDGYGVVEVLVGRV